eukprot:9085969-Lingulodinium_polyedra.AAC.1
MRCSACRKRLLQRPSSVGPHRPSQGGQAAQGAMAPPGPVAGELVGQPRQPCFCTAAVGGR